ncbi:MAG: hypothetical protein KAI29_12895, partial [Cyclobacteriaceae bacterium]|nr:hypothetical protein [Cyclobacteriaceae bacterium]
MKKLAISLILMSTGYMILAQNEYKTEMKNNPDSKIEIHVGSHNVQIIGHDKDEIIITTDFSGEYIDSPSGKKKEAPDRAAGLKPLTIDASDNTGIGLVVEKEENFFSVLKISQNARNKTYKFFIPNMANLMVNDLHAQIETTYSIDNHKGEIEIMALNSQIKMNNVSGPVVANATNGNVEVVFSIIAPDKPNSFLSVNGYVDVTLPKNVAADIKLNTVNGEVYTDMDINVEKDASSSFPVIAANMNMFNLEGKINGGGTPISIQSVNGD